MSRWSTSTLGRRYSSQVARLGFMSTALVQPPSERGALGSSSRAVFGGVAEILARDANPGQRGARVGSGSPRQIDTEVFQLAAEVPVEAIPDVEHLDVSQWPTREHLVMNFEDLQQTRPAKPRRHHPAPLCSQSEFRVAILWDLSVIDLAVATHRNGFECRLYSRVNASLQRTRSLSLVTPSRSVAVLAGVEVRRYTHLSQGVGRNEHPTFSPSGNHIDFSSDRISGAQIWTTAGRRDAARVRHQQRTHRNAGLVITLINGRLWLQESSATPHTLRIRLSVTGGSPAVRRSGPRRQTFQRCGYPRSIRQRRAGSPARESRLCGVRVSLVSPSRSYRERRLCYADAVTIGSGTACRTTCQIQEPNTRAGAASRALGEQARHPEHSVTRW